MDIPDIRQYIINLVIESTTTNDILNLIYVSKDFNNYINTLCIYIYQINNFYCAVYLKNYPKLKNTCHFYTSEYHHMSQTKYKLLCEAKNYDIVKL
jgi:hypothetical protein